MQPQSPIELYKISQFNEPYLHSVSRNTFEKGKAKNIFDGFYKKQLWQEESLYIIVGSDSGLLVDYIIEHGLAYGSRYIVIDLPNVIESIESQLTFTEWDEKISLCTPDKWQKIAEDYKIQSYLFTEKVAYIKSLAAVDCYDQNYYELDSKISLEYEIIQHKTSMSLSRRPFMTRQIENLSENHSPLISIRQHLENKDCIILAGGPSLDETINWVKENKNNVIIIAASRIAKKLLHENLTPHIVISVDPHEVSFDVSREMLELPDSVIFLHSSYVVPSLLGQWKGRHYYMGAKTPWISKWNTENIALSGPTVTNAAINAAVQLGFKQILLTGVDLCYNKEGHSHAQSSNEANAGPILNKKGQWIKTYAGNFAESTPSFLQATHVLSEQAKYATEHGCFLTNLSMNAAEIPGIPHTPLNEVVLNTKENSYEELAKISTNGRIDTNQQNKTLLADVEKLIKDINDVSTIAINALKDNAALYKNYSNENKNFQFKLKLDKAEKKLDSKYEKVSVFIKQFGIKYFIKSVRTDTEEEWSDEKMEEVGRIYYQSFIDSITDVKPLLIDAKQRIKSRLEEDKPKVTLTNLFKQWRNDKQFKRALNWQQKYPEKFSLCSTDEKQTFNEIAQEYQEILTTADTAHNRRSKEYASLAGVNRKIVHLFQKRNTEGLNNLVQSLNAMISSKSDAIPLHNIALGYLNVLNNDFYNASISFKKVEDKYLTEDEGLQMVAIAINLNDVEDAEKTLKKLANISDVYQPKYAKILALNNKVDLALEEYNQYLAVNNQDVMTWLELGKLYQKSSNNESALTCLNRVLELDNANAEAQHLVNTIKA